MTATSAPMATVPPTVVVDRTTFTDFTCSGTNGSCIWAIVFAGRTYMVIDSRLDASAVEGATLALGTFSESARRDPADRGHRRRSRSSCAKRDLLLHHLVEAGTRHATVVGRVVSLVQLLTRNRRPAFELLRCPAKGIDHGRCNVRSYRVMPAPRRPVDHADRQIRLASEAVARYTYGRVADQVGSSRQVAALSGQLRSHPSTTRLVLPVLSV